MSETQNLTQEQKEKNQKYILDNLDEFVFDEDGNFNEFADPDSEYFFVPKGAVSNWEEIIKTIYLMILQNKEDWEVVVKGKVWYFIRNREDGREFSERGFGYLRGEKFNELFLFSSMGYQLVGELGYREGRWEDYEEKKEKENERYRNWQKEEEFEERDELNEEIETKSFETILREIKDWEIVFGKSFDGKIDEGKIKGLQHKSSKRRMKINAFDFEDYYRIIGELGHRKNIWKNYEETIKFWEERDKLFRKNSNNNSNNTHFTPPKNPPKEKSDPNKPTNPLPSPTSIQDQYNSDQDKERIENNSDLTPEQNQANEELLKIIISAELLIQENQFHPQILAKLVSEREKNNPTTYQILNQEGRIDKAINQLESIQQSPQNDNPIKSPKNEKENRPPLGTIFGILLPFLVSYFQ